MFTDCEAVCEQGISLTAVFKRGDLVSCDNIVLVVLWAWGVTFDCQGDWGKIGDGLLD